MNRVLAKWNVKAGVEFTRIHLIHPDFSDDKETAIDAVDAAVNKDKKLKPLIWNIGYDPGCIEIPSNPLKSWKKLRHFYMKIDSICEKYGFTANDNAVGTGSHIHIEHKGDKNLQTKIFRDMYYRPYVSWAFANPQDDINCQVLATGKFPHWSEHHYVTYYDTAVYSNLVYSGCALRMQQNTIEFRVFDMTWNWEEQEEHMAYVQAYVAWIKSDAYTPPTPLKVTHFKQIPLATAKRLFKNHIIRLGLPWQRYKKYVGYIEGHYHWNNLGNSRTRGRVSVDVTKTMQENIQKYDVKRIKNRL